MDRDYFVGRNGEALDWMYVSLGGKVVEVKATLVREMLEALEAAERIFGQGTDNTTIDEWDDAYGKVQTALVEAYGEEGQP